MRIHRLDALRGALAIGVLLYHTQSWAPMLLGTYGVYAFFTLSGFALEHVYRGRLDVRAFARARFARLAPLWILVVLVTCALRGEFDPAALALNLTGAVAIAGPNLTIPSGGWSIAIELSCYALFPLLTRFSTRGLAVLTVAAYGLRVGWVNAVWPPGASLGAVWIPYTVLPSFLVFFVLGMWLARVGDHGSWRGRPAASATLLGDVSYGVYLLHPVIWAIFDSGVAALVLTIPAAYAVHRWYEVPVGRWLRHGALIDVRELLQQGGSLGGARLQWARVRVQRRVG